MKYLAKPGQSYEDHIYAVYKVWKKVIKYKQNLIKYYTEKNAISEKRLIKGSLSTIVLHDLGKMTVQFQNMIRGKEKDNYRHELISFFYTMLASQQLNKNEKWAEIPVEALAVLGHHRPLDSDMSFFERERLNKPKLIVEGIEEALNLADEIFIKEGWQPLNIKNNLKNFDPYKYAKDFITYFLPKMLEKINNKQNIRQGYILLKGLLQYADWYGSGCKSLNYYIHKEEEELELYIKKRCKEKNIIFNGFNQFQKKVGKTKGNALVIAPTGSGKTEAAILWAINNLKDMGKAKIIYLLPTKVTANSIWQRLGEFFGFNNVGLVHSGAYLFLDEKQEDNLDFFDYLYQYSFMYPVTVATIDQLLSSGFNSSKWVLREINAQNALIIMDEIHSYDYWTLGLIISMIRGLKNSITRFFIMSATMPGNLENLLVKEIDEIEIIRDKQFLQSSRSTYEVYNYVIDEADQLILKAIREGKKVLVVVNSVSKCQNLAKKYSKFDPLCYHSRFILKDRRRIESIIEEKSFVIATQVVEVALDIDFDYLFTECAPPDAIAQRAGRINRYREKNRDSKLYIFKSGKKSQVVYDPFGTKGILKKTLKEFQLYSNTKVREEELNNIINKVYDGYELEQDKIFLEALNIYNSIQKKRNIILDSRLDEEKEETRKSYYKTLQVIPYCFKDIVMELEHNEKELYKLAVPMWYFAKNKKIIGNVFFCDMKYDPFLGGILKQDETLEDRFL